MSDDEKTKLALDWRAVAAINPALGAVMALATKNDPSPQMNTTANASPNQVKLQKPFRDELHELLTWLISNYWIKDEAKWYKRFDELHKLIEIHGEICETEDLSVFQLDNGAKLPLIIKKDVRKLWGLWHAPRANEHQGIDIGASMDTAIPAVETGVVTFAAADPKPNGKWKYGYGGQVWLYHERFDVSTFYAHLQSISIDEFRQDTAIREGIEIRKGKEIGRSGNSGLNNMIKKDGIMVDGNPHLHFGVYKGKCFTKGESIDPLEYPWKKKSS